MTAEDLIAKVPWVRAVTFCFALLGLNTKYDQTHLSVLETLFRAKPMATLTFDMSILIAVDFGDCAIAFVLAVTAWWVSRVALNEVNDFIKESTTNVGLVSDAVDRLVSEHTYTVTRELYNSAVSESFKDRMVTRVKLWIQASELLFGLSLSCFLFFWWGNLLDLAAGILGFIAAFVCTFTAIFVDLKHHRAHNLLDAKLRGTPPENRV